MKEPVDNNWMRTEETGMSWKTFWAFAISAALIIVAVFTWAACTTPVKASTHRPETIGANRNDWVAFHKDIPQSHAVRTYDAVTDHIPKTWPDYGPGIWVSLSIRPSYEALTGHTAADVAERASIVTLCKSATPHSRLDIDQENAGGNPLDYPPSIHNPAHYVTMQKVMVRLCKGTHVRFGVVIIAPYGSVLKWIYKGDAWFGFDLYAFDRYLRNGKLVPTGQAENFTTSHGKIDTAAVVARLASNTRVLKAFTGRRCPAIELGETNTHWDYQRQTWFNTITGYYAHNGCGPRTWILTRWTPKDKQHQPHFGLSGPYPPSAAVVADLKHLAWSYQ